MAFIPSSTISLCHVEFDNSYKNQVIFDDLAEQKRYFEARAKKTFTDYLVVRKTLPSGALQSSVKVNANIDSLYGCNYMYYCNENHGQRVFYAFINDLVYINEGTTEIVFETDVYQTWQFDITLLESFVKREHSKTDNIGDNIVPEPFSFDEYVHWNPSGVAEDETSLYEAMKQWGYLIVCSEPPNKDSWDASTMSLPTSGVPQCGIYQGMFFYYFTNYIDINKFINNLNDDGLDGVLAIVCIPEFNVSHALVGGSIEEIADHIGFVRSTDYPNSKTFHFTDPVLDGKYFTNRNGTEPTLKNNKLMTYPFFKIRCTNNAGQINDYAVEDFMMTDSGVRHIAFELVGDISPNPTMMFVPVMYKGIMSAIDYATTLAGFPQCSFLSDSFKLWLARNKYEVASEGTKAIGKVVSGLAMAGAGLPTIGMAVASSGATSIANTINSVRKASLAPNNGNMGAQFNNLLTAMEQNKFTVEYCGLIGEYAKMVDDYFTMFGYQTNAVKVPNTYSRPYFNYVETIDVNIADKTFGIPNKDMEILKRMFNNGVTLWKPQATIGDYSVDNSPS